MLPKTHELRHWTGAKAGSRWTDDRDAETGLLSVSSVHCRSALRLLSLMFLRATKHRMQMHPRQRRRAAGAVHRHSSDRGLAAASRW